MSFPSAPTALILAGLLAATAAPPTAQAQARFNLPAGALADSLSQISLQSGRTISASAELIAGRQAAPVRDATSAEAAARQALQGSGLELVVTPSGVLSVRPQPAAAGQPVSTLATVQVRANTDIMPSEGTGSYTAPESASATRLRLSLRETPQSVSVITRQQMDDQGLMTVADALQQTPGIAVVRENSEGYAFYARGFQLQNFQFDGLPSLSSDGGNVRDNYSLSSSVMYDRIEVLKGATGLVNGVGHPSGVVNFIRKRPTGEFKGSVVAGVGTWDRVRGEVDLGGPLTESGVVRGRLVAASETHGSYMDFAKGKEHVLYGIVEADLTPDTLATFGVDYQGNHNRATSNTHLPAFFSDGRPVTFARSTNPADRWARRNQDTRRAFADLTHHFDNGWQIKAALAHRNYRSRELIAGMSSDFVDAQTHRLAHGYYQGGVADFGTDSRENSIDLLASGTYPLFGRQHDLVIGYNAARTRTQSNRSDGDTDLWIEDAFGWDNQATQPTTYERWLTNDVRVDQRIFYGATVLRPTDRLALILGGRLSDYTWFLQSDFANGRRPNYATDVNNKFIPYAGITFDVDREHTVYASYTDVFRPQAFNFDASNRQLDPLTGKNYEVGAKGEYLDGRVNASVALFQIKQDNVAELDIGAPTLPSGATPYRAVQGVTTRGFELEVAGELLPGWQLHAGYTLARSRDRHGDRVSTTQPQQLFKLATTYRLPGAWNRLTLGGNVHWQSAAYFEQEVVEDTKSRFTQETYAVLGLMAAYDISRQLRVTVNLNNVFDKHYYSGLGNYNSVYYGEPRNLLAQVRYTF